MRPILVFGLMLCVGGGSVGCANSSGLARHARTPMISQRTPAQGDPFQSSDQPKPEITPGEVAANKQADAKPPDAKPPDTKQPDEPSGESTKLARFDAATLKLIHEELHGASQEERDYWFEQLKRVDPSVVPDILRARRLSMRMHDQATKFNEVQLAGIEEVDSTASGASPITPVGDSWGHTNEQTESPANSAPYAGLGSANPWKREASGTDNPAPQTLPTSQQAVAFTESPPEPQRSATPPRTTLRPNRQAEPQAPIALSGVDPTTPARSGANPTPTVSTPSESNPFAIRNETASATVATNSPPKLPDILPAESAPPGDSAVQTTNPGQLAIQQPLKSADPWEQELQRLISQVEAEVAQLKPTGTPREQQEFIRRHVYLRMLYLMDQRQERALAAIPGAEPADQEFWQQLFWAVANYFDSEHIPEGSERAAQTVAQLNDAVRRLQEKSRLELRNMAFCTNILSYGNYEKFPRDEFTPGQEVLLYVEVENYKSEPTADNRYRTLLRSTIDLLSPAGDVRKRIEFKATEDLCRNYRRDYFHSYQFKIPQTMPLGPHTLKLTVFDELSGKMISSSLNFTVK